MFLLLMTELCCPIVYSLVYSLFIKYVYEMHVTDDYYYFILFKVFCFFAFFFDTWMHNFFSIIPYTLMMVHRLHAWRKLHITMSNCSSFTNNAYETGKVNLLWGLAFVILETHRETELAIGDSMEVIFFKNGCKYLTQPANIDYEKTKTEKITRKRNETRNFMYI